MDRLTFNGLLLAFFVICDVITWSFVSNGKDPLPILISIQLLSLLIANACKEADQFVVWGWFYGQFLSSTSISR